MPALSYATKTVKLPLGGLNEVFFLGREVGVCLHLLWLQCVVRLCRQLVILAVKSDNRSVMATGC